LAGVTAKLQRHLRLQRQGVARSVLRQSRAASPLPLDADARGMTMSQTEAVAEAVPRKRPSVSRPVLPSVRRRVVVAEEQAATRGLLGKALRAAGFDVTELADGLALWNELRLLNDPQVVDDPYAEAAAPVDLVVCDVRMPGLDGLEVLARVRDHGWTTPVILVNPLGGVEPLLEGKRLGAQRVFDRPLDVRHLVEAAQGLLDPAE
jgi:CheY-like chemotaxis protein